MQDGIPIADTGEEHPLRENNASAAIEYLDPGG